MHEIEDKEMKLIHIQDYQYYPGDNPRESLCFASQKFQISEELWFALNNADSKLIWTALSSNGFKMCPKCVTMV